MKGDAVDYTAGYSVAISADGNIIAFGVRNYPRNVKAGTWRIGLIRMFQRDSSNIDGWTKVGVNLMRILIIF